MNHDPLDTCPYDPVHRILRSRMQFHLTRCSKNFPSSKKKQCPYDARHIVNQIEYDYHINNCPSRESVWHYKLRDQPDEQPDGILPIGKAPKFDSEENWDEDIDVKSYNPLQHIQDRPIVRTIIGASKAKRKQFRMEERLRIQQIDNEKERHARLQQITTGNINKQTKKNTNDLQNSNQQAEKEYKPLRRPKKLSDSLNMSGLSLNDSNTMIQKPNTLEQINQKTKDVSSVAIQEEVATCAKQEPGNIIKNNSVAVEEFKQAKLEAAAASRQVDILSASVIKEIRSAEAAKQPISKPFSYAAALSKNSKITNETIQNSNEFDRDVKVEKVTCNEETENVNNSLYFNHTADDSIIEKLSKTVEEIAISDEGHKKKREPLDKILKQMQFQGASNSTNNNITPNFEKKSFSRCAANFAKLK